MFTKKFSEIDYKRPDLEAVRKEFAIYMDSFKNEKAYEEARRLFLEHNHDHGALCISMDGKLL